MKYINATEVLPPGLLKQVQSYVKSGLLYIPEKEKKVWGLESGSKDYYSRRNREIKLKYSAGNSVEALSEEYGLAYNTIKKIIYRG